jgi:hypothetical protein
MYRFTQNGPFTRQGLEEVRQRLARMNKPELLRFYEASLTMCRVDQAGRPPNGSFVQQLVQAWKELVRRTRVGS